MTNWVEHKRGEWYFTAQWFDDWAYWVQSAEGNSDKGARSVIIAAPYWMLRPNEDNDWEVMVETEGHPLPLNWEVM